jgi:hypothetical protein
MGWGIPDIGFCLGICVSAGNADVAQQIIVQAQQGAMLTLQRLYGKTAGQQVPVPWASCGATSGWAGGVMCKQGHCITFPEPFEYVMDSSCCIRMLDIYAPR